MTFQAPCDPREDMRGRDFHGAVALVILTRGAGAARACWAEDEAAAVDFLNDPAATPAAKRALRNAIWSPEKHSAPSPTEPNARIYGVLVSHYDGDVSRVLGAFLTEGLWFWRVLALADDGTGEAPIAQPG